MHNAAVNRLRCIWGLKKNEAVKNKGLGHYSFGKKQTLSLVLLLEIGMLQTFALKSRLNNKIIQPVIYHRLPYDAELMPFSHNNTSFLAVSELPKN